MIIIGLDISLSSTAMCINDNGAEYIYCYLNTNKVSKWANLLEGDISNLMVTRLERAKKAKNYSDGEISKLLKYDEISELILNDIIKRCGNRKCEIRMEGYSYTKNTNSIIDIIGLSTQLRLKLLTKLNSSLHIISPSTLKLSTCKLAYGVTEIKRYGKKDQPLKSNFKVMNKEGISGGSFTKFEMYKSIIDGNIDTIIYDFLNEYESDVISMKKIPSPIDDIIDSVLITRINL